MTTTVRPTSADDPIAAEPRLGTTFRKAGQDFYFNSWRLVPANLVWAVVLAAVIIAALVWLPAALLVVVVAVPLAGIHRMAALLVREQGASFSDFIDGMRRSARRAVTAGAAATILAVTFSSNVLLGLQLDNPFGWFLTATAAYADVALAMVLVAFWPLLVDPQREGRSLRRLVVLAGIVCLARPGRMFLLTVLIGLILVAATAILPAIALVGVSFVSLVATRYVLPLADHLESRAGSRVR
jgi:uncharacterized membrane protein YesL